MMFAKVMATAVTIGVMGGASLAVAQNLSSPQPVTAMNSDTQMQPIAKRAENVPCADVDFRVYFAPDSDDLSPEARDLIATAARDVSQCGRLDIEVAADASRLDTGGERRLSSQRSVAVLSEIRRHGVSGDVFVAPVKEIVVAAEDNAGPDFVEIGLAASAGGQLLSSATGTPTSM